MTDSDFIPQSKTKQLLLTNGEFTIVDEEDYEFLRQWNWHPDKHGYAYRRELIGKLPNGNRKFKRILMHKVIMNRHICQEIDHKNGDVKNNSKNNLRPATHQQNMMNRRKNEECSSKYKGVYRLKRYTNKWEAYVNFNSKKNYIGLFNDEITAAKAYNKLATELFGEFARLNQIPDLVD